MKNKLKLSRRTVTPIGAIDGVNKVFTLLLPSFREGSEMVFRDGILQEEGEENDYVLEYFPLLHALQITFAEAPLGVSKVTVNVKCPSQD